MERNNFWEKEAPKSEMSSFVATAGGESRGELIAWMNDLLQLGLTKVEQAGTGAPLCQIFDSIYGTISPD